MASPLPGARMHDESGIERSLRDSAIRGDTQAWQALYDSAYESVRGYVFWRTGGSRELAEEVLQESWLIVVRKLGDFSPEKSQFRQWVCGIAVNVIRNQLRSRRRCRVHVQAIPAQSESPVQTADPGQAEQVAIALDALEERQERVLRAKYLEGASVEQIALQERSTVKAIESLLSRAREAFRKVYEEQRVNHDR